MNICDFGEGEFSAIKGFLYKRFSASYEELMSPWRDLMLFYIWRDAKISIIRSVPKNIYLRPVPWASREHRVPPSPPWIPLRGCWRSATAARVQSLQKQVVNDLVVVDVQSLANVLGKWQFVVDNVHLCKGILSWFCFCVKSVSHVIPLNLNSLSIRKIMNSRCISNSNFVYMSLAIRLCKLLL